MRHVVESNSTAKPQSAIFSFPGVPVFCNVCNCNFSFSKTGFFEQTILLVLVYACTSSTLLRKQSELSGLPLKRLQGRWAGGGGNVPFPLLLSVFRGGLSDNLFSEVAPNRERESGVA